MTYLGMVLTAMRSEREAQPWYDYLKQLQSRRDAERELIHDVQKKHPGRVDFEVLAEYKEWLDKNFPVPELQEESKC